MSQTLSDQEIFRDKYLETRDIHASCRSVNRNIRWGYRQLNLPYMSDAREPKPPKIVSIPKKITALVPVSTKIVKAVVLELDAPELVKAQWEDIIFGRRKQVQTIRDKEGNSFTVEEEFSDAVIAKCLEMYARALGMFKDKVEISAGEGATVSFIQIDNGRGPVPKQLSADLFLSCKICQESISEKDLAKHEESCEGSE